MKKLSFLLMPFMPLCLAMGASGCSSNDEPATPEPVGPEPVADYHFDLWVALDRHGGMARDVQTLVRSLNSLDASVPEITFQGVGTEVNSILSLETILKGAYYYQVPVSGDRFAKYIIRDNAIEVVRERRFQTNTYSTRKYTHAWTDDNTLVIMAAADGATKVVWTKLNATDMSIIAEGTLDITMPEGGEMFTTSGLLTYRPSDNRLFYLYYAKTGGKRGKRVSPMTVAVINPADMSVEATHPCFLDCEMVGSAYGELLQTTTAVDDSGNIYIACFTEDPDGSEHSHLLRIPAGSTDFDPSYDGFTGDGKLISIMNIGHNKVMAYAREDALGTNIDDFSHYYTVIDLATGVSTPVTFNGVRLAYSSGRFSSRMAFVGQEAFIGVDALGSQPQIYIYDTATGNVKLGASMAPGYYFEQIRVVDNL